MRLDTALSAMNLIANTGRKGLLDGIGISRQEFDRLVSDEPWIGADRNRMTTVLHTLINASVDYCGLPRFDLPAEYVAAGISVFCAGINLQAACVFAASLGLQSADSMGRMSTMTPATASQLFALVMQLYDNPGHSAARAQFEKNTGLAIDKVMVHNLAVTGKSK